jgi:hypothetical protein
MTIQQQITAYCRMARVLEMIQRTEEIITVSSLYLDNHKRYMQPIVDFHRKEVDRYKAVHDRLVKYANGLSSRLYYSGLPSYETEEMMNALPF